MSTAKLVDAGIDYIRVTSQESFQAAKFLDYYEHIRKEDEALGYKEHGAGAFGFFGRATRHALVAQKNEWTMLQVSGGRAKDSYLLIHPRSQATRIDIQATLQLKGQTVGEYIRKLYNTACSHTHATGRPPSVRMIEERHVAQTVYIGSRASDFFIRIYDKYQESGDDRYMGCVRLELEIKGRASKAIWRKMAEEGKGVGYLLKVLESMLLTHGIVMPAEVTRGNPPVLPPRETRTIDSTMMWLKKSVAPSFARCAVEFGWLQPLLTILDGLLYDKEVCSIARNLAKEWGS